MTGIEPVSRGDALRGVDTALNADPRTNGLESLAEYQQEIAKFQLIDAVPYDVRSLLCDCGWASVSQRVWSGRRAASGHGCALEASEKGAPHFERWASNDLPLGAAASAVAPVNTVVMKKTVTKKAPVKNAPTEKVPVKKITAKAATVKQAPAKAAPSPADKVLARAKSSLGKNRPTKLTALLRHLKSIVGQGATDAGTDTSSHRLEDAKVIQVVGDLVRYP